MENNKIDNLKVKLMNSFQDPLKAMWIAARNCYYRGGFEELEKTFNREFAIELVKNVYHKGHLSILEMSPFQFAISGMSRSCLAQFTRHRIGNSFAVQSQHYQNHKDFHYKDLEVYANEEHRKEYYALMEAINKFYIKTQEHGLPRYIAREVLPNATSVHLVASMNLRSLDNFWRLRKGPENTPEIRTLSLYLYQATQGGFRELSKIIPYE